MENLVYTTTLIQVLNSVYELCLENTKFYNNFEEVQSIVNILKQNMTAVILSPEILPAHHINPLIDSLNKFHETLSNYSEFPSGLSAEIKSLINTLSLTVKLKASENYPHIISSIYDNYNDSLIQLKIIDSSTIHSSITGGVTDSIFFIRLLRKVYPFIPIVTESEDEFCYSFLA